MDNSIRQFFLGRGDFKSANEIIAIVRSQAADESESEGGERSDALLIFQTSKQQTWLVATRRALYCVLDDLHKGFTRIQWTLPADKLVGRSGMIAQISTSDKSEKTGLLHINGHRNWLYSKKLFTSSSIEGTVRDLIRRTVKDYA